MIKQEFLKQLKCGLSGLPKKDIDEHIDFYSEIIDDKIEDGKTEETAVFEIGNIDEIISQIISDTPFTKIVKEKIKTKRKLSILEIVLLVLGSPIWVSILITILAIIFSIYISLWSIVISLWAVFISLIASSFGGIFASFVLAFTNNLSTGFALFGVSLVLFGIPIYLFFVCKIVSKYYFVLTKKLLLSIKNKFINKEVVWCVIKQKIGL